MKKRVLITGGAGFLGSHLCDYFIEKDYRVVAMDNLITGDIRNIEHLFSHPDFEFYHHDVSKYIHVPGKLDYILHFASPASPIDYLKYIGQGAYDAYSSPFQGLFGGQQPQQPGQQMPGPGGFFQTGIGGLISGIGGGLGNINWRNL